MPRPQIDEETYAQIRQIHNQFEGESPENFEDALKTVISLAAVQAEREGKPLEQWYLGKNAERMYATIRNKISGDNLDFAPQDNHDSDSTGGGIDEGRFEVGSAPSSLKLLESTAVFKAVLSAEGNITVPDAERRALGLAEDDLLQVIAKRLEPDKDKVVEMEEG